MAISINHLTRVITIPQADLTLISGSQYQLDINDLKAWLEDLLDSEQEITLPSTHRHNTTLVIAGITYARTFEIINGFTVEFEDGTYTATTIGANHNLSDVKVQSQVSLVTNNSAGLQIVTQGSGLSASEQTKLDELWKLQGLDIANPMTVTPTSRDAGSSVSQTISGDGETTSTVTRDP
jgi:hypothetical protein